MVIDEHLLDNHPRIITSISDYIWLWRGCHLTIFPLQVCGTIPLKQTTSLQNITHLTNSILGLQDFLLPWQPTKMA